MSLQADKIRLLMELRRLGITDTAVLSLIETIPREYFVSQAFLKNAYDNIVIPIGYSQTLSQPYTVAFMTQALRLNDRCKTLEIGTGSGYQSLVLSHLCRRLYTIERHAPLLQQAEQRFSHFQRPNIVTRLGDGSLGWQEQAPFDRIIVTAAAADIPPTLADQMSIGGIMVTPVGDDPNDQWLVRVTRTEHHFDIEELQKTRFVPLIPSEANYD